MHRLLRHLEAEGFPGSPRFLGVDDKGREILSYIEGVAGLHPFSPLVRTSGALVESVRLMRHYHDCTTSMRGLTGPWPGESRLDLPVEVVCHRDLAPYNFIYRDGSPVGIIDFDNARPGSRIEDVAYFAYRSAPLSAECNYADAGWPGGTDWLGRLQVILEQYGEMDYSALVDIVIVRLAEMISWIRTRADRGDPSVAVHVAEDHIGIYKADLAWIRANIVRLRAVTAA